MLKTTRDKVLNLLKLYPNTRDNDNLLIAYYMELEYGVTDTFDIARKFSANVYESVRRARQKVMEENPDLRPSKAVYKKRLEKEQKVREEVINSKREAKKVEVEQIGLGMPWQ